MSDELKKFNRSGSTTDLSNNEDDLGKVDTEINNGSYLIYNSEASGSLSLYEQMKGLTMSYHISQDRNGNNILWKITQGQGKSSIYFPNDKDIIPYSNIRAKAEESNNQGDIYKSIKEKAKGFINNEDYRRLVNKNRLDNVDTIDLGKFSRVVVRDTHILTSPNRRNRIDYLSYLGYNPDITSIEFRSKVGVYLVYDEPELVIDHNDHDKPKLISNIRIKPINFSKEGRSYSREDINSDHKKSKIFRFEHDDDYNYLLINVGYRASMSPDGRYIRDLGTTTHSGYIKIDLNKDNVITTHDFFNIEVTKTTNGGEKQINISLTSNLDPVTEGIGFGELSGVYDGYGIPDIKVVKNNTLYKPPKPKPIPVEPPTPEPVIPDTGSESNESPGGQPESTEPTEGNVTEETNTDPNTEEPSESEPIPNEPETEGESHRRPRRSLIPLDDEEDEYTDDEIIYKEVMTVNKILDDIWIESVVFAKNE